MNGLATLPSHVGVRLCDRPGFAGHPADTLSTGEVVRATGATLRQLDYGYRAAVLIPEPGGRGSGGRLRWSRYEAAVIARLITVERALPFTNFAELARHHAATLRAGHQVVLVGPWGTFVIHAVTL